MRCLRDEGILDDAILVLIGSYARDAVTWRSDVDMLLLTDQPLAKRPLLPYGVHLRCEGREQFQRRLLEGDDYAIAAVRYGRLLHGDLGFWNELLGSLGHAKWPDPKAKLAQTSNRLTRADDLRRMTDIDAAIEEYLGAATQIARSTLLQQRVFPLSRAELSEQLRGIDENLLADRIDTLIQGECTIEDLEIISRDLRSALCREEDN